MWAIVGLKYFRGDVGVKDAQDTSNDPSNDQKDSPGVQVTIGCW